MHNTQHILGIGIPLFCRLAIPLHCLCIVLTDALPLNIHSTQIILGLSNSLFCRFPIPLYCLCIVLTNAFTFFIRHTQIILGLSIPLFCRLAIPLHRLFIVLTDSSSIVVHHTQIKLGVNISLLCSLKHFLKIRHIISPSCLHYAQSQQSNHHFFQYGVHLKILFYLEFFWVCLCTSDDLWERFHYPT